MKEFIFYYLVYSNKDLSSDTFVAASSIFRVSLNLWHKMRFFLNKSHNN